MDAKTEVAALRRQNRWPKGSLFSVLALAVTLVALGGFRIYSESLRKPELERELRENERQAREEALAIHLDLQQEAVQNSNLP